MKVIMGLDYLGTKPSLYINGERSYKTTLGGTISFMITLCIISGVCYFLNLLLSKATFTVETSEEYYPDSFADWSNIDLTMLVVDKAGMPYPEQDRLFSVTSMWWKYLEYTKPDKTLGMDLQMMPVKMEKCNLTHYSDPTLWIGRKTINISYCVAPQQKLNISKIYGAINSTTMLFWVHRCKNTTTKNDCFPPEKIEQDLMNASLGLRFRNYYFDHKKTENIGTPYLFIDAPIASSTNYRRIRYTLQEVEYSVDNGLIFPNHEQHNYVTFNSFRESIDFRTDPVVPGALIGISFDMHILKQKVKKNYYKFQNMLADLGGLYKAILTIVTFFNGYFSDRFYYNEIIEKNLNSMSEKNLSSNLGASVPKLNFELGFSNSNVLNLGQSQSNLLNLNVNRTIRANKNFSTRQADFTTPVKNKNNMGTLKIQESNNTTPEKDNKITSESHKKLKCHQIIFPIWCFNSRSNSGQNLRMHRKFKNFIINQLDIVSFLEKMNNFDKISLILTGGENKQLLHKCINPNYYEENQMPPMSEFNEVKNKIITDMSNVILNSFQEKDGIE
jgi:hypothetical protein